MSVVAGDRLGPYEIVSRIGAGGMGEVWRARDTRLDRNVAIKILPAEYAHDARLKVRFEREAKAISQLNHPHICTLYDIGDGYLVMELLEGESLADRVVRGPLPVSDVLRYGAQIADALGRAHRAGIIHRDLKPGNIILTRGGAKLLDFGLAKTTQLEFSADGATQQKPLTAEGTIVGTFQYMAPEQIEGLDADVRSDLWSLGAVLYEMATGKRAFEAKTRTSLIAAIVSGEPKPMTELQPLTPPVLEHVVAKCLSKDPDDRWQSAHDIAEELRWLGASSSRAAAIPIRRQSRERWLWLAALLVALAALAAVAFRPKPQPEMLAVSLMPEADEGLTYNSSPPALSPDGRQLVYSSTGADGTRMLYLRTLDQTTTRAIAGTVDTNRPAWSPDGRSILFIDLRNGSLKTLSLSGGEAERVADSTGGSWSTDGTILHVGRTSPRAVERIRASGGESSVVLTADSIGAELLVSPRALPDNNHFLVLALGETLARKQQSGLWLATIDKSEPPRFLTAATSHARYVTPGYLLFARDSVLCAQRFDAKHLRLEGNATTIATIQTRGWTALFDASDNGLLVYQAPRPAPQSELVLRNRKGERLGTVGVPAFRFSPRVSPDGRHVAVDRSDDHGNGDIWVEEIAGGAAQRVTFEALNETGPLWSSRGDAIVWCSEDGTLRGGSILRKTLGGRPEVLMNGPVGVLTTDWSPDGKYVLYRRGNGVVRTDVAAWAIDEKRSIDIAATPARESSGVFSPDGKWVAYQSDETGRFELYVQPFPPTGAKEQVSTNGGSTPRWLRSGEIAYLDPAGGINVVKVTTSPSFRVTPPQLLFTSPRIADAPAFDVTPDGNFLINERLPSEPKPMTLLVNWERKLR